MSLVPVCDVCGVRITLERREETVRLPRVKIGSEQFEDACQRCEAGLLRMLEALKDRTDPTLETLPALPAQQEAPRARVAEGWGPP